jgi:hypothetical protein
MDQVFPNYVKPVCQLVQPHVSPSQTDQLLLDFHTDGNSKATALPKQERNDTHAGSKVQQRVRGRHPDKTHESNGVSCKTISMPGLTNLH